jgi:hypothetical protein
VNGTETAGSDGTQSGFAVSTDSTLSVNVSTSSDGAVVSGNSFNDSTTTLTASTPYFYRAYVTNSGGTGYGVILSFTTSAPTPPPRIIRIRGHTRLQAHVRFM